MSDYEQILRVAKAVNDGVAPTIKDLESLIICCARLLKNSQLGACDSYPGQKRCPSCQRDLLVRVGVTFNKKASTSDGLQPWCRECDAKNKNGTKNGWINFLRTLRSRSLGEELLWTEDSYRQMMGDWSCHYCGNKVHHWGSGYWVDKISSLRGYTPDNTVPCCKPCNFEKKNKNPESWSRTLNGILSAYPRGKVPWNELAPSYRFTGDSTPDLSGFICAQRMLF